MHVVIFESEAWFRPLRFRDRLRADAAARQAYEDLKEGLVATTGSRGQYTAGKTAFVQRMSA